MTRQTTMIAIAIAAVGLMTGAARAQPVDPYDEPAAPDDPDPDRPPVAQPVPPERPTAEPAAEPAPTVAEPEPLHRGGFQPPVRRPRRPIDMPSMFAAPTGYLLPAGVIYSQFGLDTGGGVNSDSRIGLGDVAEFGFGTSDQIKVVECAGNDCSEPDAVQPYALAQFRMGVPEERLFDYQPAVTLGFRKSFTRKHDRRKTRVAELYLVASKKLGDATKIHVGGTFWDAGIRRDTDGAPEILLHDDGIGHQLRPFGGIEVRPMPRSTLMLELGWAPVFELRDAAGQSDDIDLRPFFSWGVRYELAEWGQFESGVRIPDIQDINLLDAQIFGQLKLVSRRFANFLDGMR